MKFIKKICWSTRNNKSCFPICSNIGVFWLLVAGALLVVDFWVIFLWAPRDTALGDVQRILYLHVPAAWVSFFAFFIVFCMSIWYFFQRSDKADRIAHASAEVGILFTTIFLISGILWAKPVWGVWWTWDPRLTTTLIMWLIYSAYLMVRVYAGSNKRAARWSATIGILGFFNIPIVYASTIWWRTIHPQQMVGPASDPSNALPDPMRITLYFSVVVFTVLFFVLLNIRCNLLSAEHKIAIIDHQSNHERL